MSFEQWAADRQMAWNTPRAVLEDLVQSACGRRPETMDRIQGGAMNEVWRVAAGGVRLILRIAHRADDRLAAEGWALAECARAGVPVARVLHIEDRRASPDPLFALVLSEIPGDLFEQEVGRIPRSEQLAVAEQLGAVLRDLHSVRVDGLGYVDAAGRTGRQDWAWAHPSSLLKSVDKWVAAATRRSGIDSTLVDKAVGCVRARLHDFPLTDVRLVHADLRPAHVLVDGGRVSGLLDFEFCQGGDPIYDLAYWDHNHRDEEFTDAMFAGYRLERSEAVESKFRCCRLIVALQYLCWFAGEEDPWPGLATTIAESLESDLARI